MADNMNLIEFQTVGTWSGSALFAHGPSGINYKYYISAKLSRLNL